MIEDTLEYIDYKRDSMQPDEWLTYLEELRKAINALIELASSEDKTDG